MLFLSSGHFLTFIRQLGEPASKETAGRSDDITHHWQVVCEKRKLRPPPRVLRFVHDMDFPAHLIIPLACALIYVLGAMAMKRAAVLGVGVWRTAFVANWTMVAIFVPWGLTGNPSMASPAMYWQPAIVASFFLAGQLFIFLALSRGDVTVTTTVMGFKVVLVALFSSVLRAGDVPPRWWIGAGLSTLAVILLHAGEQRDRRRDLGLTVLLASASAAAYGLNDVLLQKWVPAWGTENFLPPMFLCLGLYSMAFLPFFHGPLGAMPDKARRWVGLGAVLMAVTNGGIVLTLSIWGDATAVNIVFSVRGLFSVLLVWLVGHWFLSNEQHLKGRVLVTRLAGAVFMIGAIILVLI
jgi:drug/metabolite transporter (DMT)-like permease